MGRPPSVKRDEDATKKIVSGTVAWAKLEEVPWWPGVLFNTWEEIDIDWCLPMRMELRPHVGPNQMIFIFLQSYNYYVFDIDDPCLEMYDGPESNPNQEKENELKNKEALERQYKRAIADAWHLYSVLHNEFEAQDICVENSTPNKHRFQELSRWARTAAMIANDSTLAQEEEKVVDLVSPPRNWVECIEILVLMQPEFGLEIKAIIERAAELAADKDIPDLSIALRQCLDDNYYPNDASEARLRALALLEAQMPEKYKNELIAHQGQIFIERKSSKKSLDSLARAVTQCFIAPGPLIIEQNEGKVIAQLNEQGLILWADEKYNSLDEFVEAVRRQHARSSNRPIRLAHTKRDRERVIHQATRTPLSILLERAQAREDEIIADTEQNISLEPIKLTRKPSSKKQDDVLTQNKRSPTAQVAQPAKKKAHIITTTGKKTKRKAEEIEEDPYPSDADDDPLENETPLSEYWLAENTSSHQSPLMACVWDDGYFTDDNDFFESFSEGLDSKKKLEHIIEQQTNNNGDRNARREYIKKRESQQRVARLIDGLSSKKLDPHALVNCESYQEEIENVKMNEEDESQPFGLIVHPDVAFLCDLHAHLAEAEIIGLLGGRWDPQNRCMHIQAPFPCRATPRDDDGATDVEMDPASELQVREVIKRHDMDVVGWYHSHPRFASEPSVTDIENQRSYQTLFHQDESGLAPFIGLIVGTYDPHNPSPRSTFRYFHVAAPPERLTRPLINPEKIQNTPLENNTCTEILFQGETTAVASASENQADLPTENEISQQSAQEDPSSAESSFKQQQRRRQRFRSNRDEAPATRRSQAPSMIPMALKAKIRSYRWGLDDNARRERRKGKIDPPLSKDAPFAFLSRCKFKCTCCPPLPDGASNLTTAASNEAPETTNVPNLFVENTSSNLDAEIKRLVTIVKAQVQKAKKSGGLEEQKQWTKLYNNFGNTHLSCVAHTIRQLGKYYCRHERRVELTTNWRKDISKWEKLLNSLALWTFKMAFDPGQRASFLTDILLYIHCCWRKKPKQRKKQQIRRR